MSPGSAAAVAIAFTWLGMVLAISFLEAPLKFRAPGVTRQIGLGIGRLVFRALNTVETVLAVAILLVVVLDPPPSRAVLPLVVAGSALAVQVLALRPVLTRRSDAVLAGRSVPRSRAHHAYVALEAGKVLALLTAGILLLG